MDRKLQQQSNDEEALAELDRFVIEAIDTLIATSKQVKSVRQRQQSERQRHSNETLLNKVTKLKSRARTEAEETQLEEQQDSVFQEMVIMEENDEDRCTENLAGMTSRQREHAEAFAGWLVQQDNYPVILQHVEELLAVMEDDFSWNDSVDGQKHAIDPDSEENEDEDKSGAEE